MSGEARPPDLAPRAAAREGAVAPARESRDVKRAPGWQLIRQMELQVSSDPMTTPTSRRRWASKHEERAAGDGGAGLVFWWLITMALVGFAPCMILPAWREYQEAELTERVRAARVAAATAEVDDLRRRLDAIHNDPAVVTRLARRELEFRKPGEAVVAVPVSGVPAVGSPPTPRPETKALKRVEPPVPIARLLAYLPDFNYDVLFCKSPTRETILALSVGLFVAAFVVFWPRNRAAAHTLPFGRGADDAGNERIE